MFYYYQVKDRFCTLLSDRVSQLETELNNSRESIDGDEESDRMKSKVSNNVPSV